MGNEDIKKSETAKSPPQNNDNIEHKGISVQRAILKEYFNDNWITVLYKVGGTAFAIVTFGFGIGWWAKGLTDKSDKNIIEKHTVEIDTVYVNRNQVVDTANSSHLKEVKK